MQIPTGNTWPSEANLYVNVFPITQQEQSFQAGPAQQFPASQVEAGTLKVESCRGRVGDPVKAWACLGNTHSKDGITNTE